MDLSECVNEHMGQLLPLFGRKPAEGRNHHFADVLERAVGQQHVVIGAVGILFTAGSGLFQLCPQVGGHLGGHFPGLTLHLFLVHHRGEGLLLERVVLGLELVAPEPGRFCHLPRTSKLVLRVLGSLFGSVALAFGLLALEPGSNAALVCIVVALLELGVLLGQAVDVGVGGFQMGILFPNLGQQLLILLVGD